MRKVCRLCIVILLTLLPLPKSASIAQSPLYATLGIESYGILRELVGSDHVFSIQTGTLSNQLDQHTFTAFVVPENRQDDPDVEVARKAGLPIITVLRHTDIASIATNIAVLGKLTDHEEKATQWINTINTTLEQLQHDLRDMPPVRVLVLSPEGYTQGQGALITNLLSQVKAINVAAEAGIPEARQISDEQIRQFAPEVVLLLNWSSQPADKLTNNPIYKGIPAFDHQRIYRITSPGKDVAHLTTDLNFLADLLHIWLF